MTINSSIQPLTSKKYWEKHYKMFDYQTTGEVLFPKLLRQYLPNGKGKTCLEIGCFPGKTLLFLAKELGYTPYGLDYANNLEQMRAFFDKNSTRRVYFFNKNFIDFKTKLNFDVVCSFGFIEHFKNFEAILRKQINLVKPGGYLVLSTPNFTHLQLILHLIFDRDNLKYHNLAAMNLNKWRNILKQHNFQPLFHGYYQTAGLWTEAKLGKIREKIFRKIVEIMERLNLQVDFPNRFTSPYMVSISKKLS